MSNYRRANIKGASNFFTVVTERRQTILTNEDSYVGRVQPALWINLSRIFLNTIFA
jgi:REP element-mobilizing transposase RayT